MRSFILSLFFIFQVLFATSARADGPQPLIGNVGRAPYSLMDPKFRCDQFVRSLRRLPAWHIAALYHTFGDSYRCWDRLMKSPKMQTIELALLNEPGHRNHRLGSYEFLASIPSPADFNRLLINQDQHLKDRFTKYVKKAQEKMAELPPQVQCLINPGLESNVSEQAGKVLISWTKELFPNCRVIWNPVTAPAKGHLAGADLVEGHGPQPPVFPACIVNLDGTDISFPERPSSSPDGNYIESGRPLLSYIEEYANRCELVFLWVAEDNCAESKFKDPRSRSCRSQDKVFPLVAKQAEIAMKTLKVFTPYDWTDTENLSLNACTQIKRAEDGDKRGFLLKQSQFRNRGGVIITDKSIRATKMKVLSDGKVIDNYTFDGNYHDGRPLWRSNLTPLNYPYHVVVQATVGNQIICYKIEDPKGRVD